MLSSSSLTISREDGLLNRRDVRPRTVTPSTPAAAISGMFRDDIYSARDIDTRCITTDNDSSECEIWEDYHERYLGIELTMTRPSFPREANTHGDACDQQISGMISL